MRGLQRGPHSKLCGKRKKRKIGQDAKDFLPQDLYEQLKIHCTYKRVGPGGKLQWSKHIGATVIFDDSPEVAKEWLEGGLMIFAVCTKWCRHGDLMDKSTVSMAIFHSKLFVYQRVP